MTHEDALLIASAIHSASVSVAGLGLTLAIGVIAIVCAIKGSK